MNALAAFTAFMLLGFFLLAYGIVNVCADEYDDVKSEIAEHIELAREAFENDDFDQGMIELDLADKDFGELLNLNT